MYTITELVNGFIKDAIAKVQSFVSVEEYNNKKNMFTRSIMKITRIILIS